MLMRLLLYLLSHSTGLLNCKIIMNLLPMVVRHCGSNLISNHMLKSSPWQYFQQPRATEIEFLTVCYLSHTSLLATNHRYNQTGQNCQSCFWSPRKMTPSHSSHLSYLFPLIFVSKLPISQITGQPFKIQLQELSIWSEAVDSHKTVLRKCAFARIFVYLLTCLTMSPPPMQRHSFIYIQFPTSAQLFMTLTSFICCL